MNHYGVNEPDVAALYWGILFTVGLWLYLFAKGDS